MTPTEVWNWFVAKPLPVLLILIGAFIVNRVLRWAVARSLRRSLHPDTRRWLRRATPKTLRRDGDDYGQRAEARVDALSTVLRSGVTVIVAIVAGLWILNVLEVNLAAFIASAGILGVALGFGAQNIVRDFLAGFFILVEDQFGVGDIVDLGEAKGTVEGITLRTTRVRDVHGTLWHVPNGQITRVANKTQQWARALVDVEVDIDTDYDLVQRVVQETADALAADPEWTPDIVDAPEVWGIEAFTAEGYMVRLVVKTKPSAQFGVVRELRVRLKRAFDDAEIRFPATHPEMWVHADSAEREPGPSGVSPTDVRPAGRPVRGDATEAE